MISFDRSVGEEVAKGEQVATLHPLDKRKPPTVLCAPNAGLLFSRRNDRYALPGQRVCEVAGKELLAENIGKDLLSD